MTDEQADREIERFFRERVLPLGEQLRSTGGRLLEAGWQPGDASYFVARTHRTMNKADFERGGLSSTEQAEGEMKGMWRSADGHPLAPLAADVAQLACKLRQQQSQSSDLPTFIYAMY